MLRFRPVSLCLWHRKEITGVLLATACSVLSVLEKLSVSYPLPSRRLFFRHSKCKPFIFFSLGHILWISGHFYCPPLHFQSGRVMLKSSAPNWTEDSSWALTNTEMTHCRLYSPMHPNITLFFLSFLQHCEFMFSWRSTVTHSFPEELLSHQLFPSLYWCQDLPAYSSGNPLELDTTTTTRLWAPDEPSMPLQCCLMKGLKLCVVLN